MFRICKLHTGQKTLPIRFALSYNDKLIVDIHKFADGVNRQPFYELF